MPVDRSTGTYYCMHMEKSGEQEAYAYNEQGACEGDHDAFGLHFAGQPRTQLRADHHTDPYGKRGLPAFPKTALDHMHDGARQRHDGQDEVTRSRSDVDGEIQYADQRRNMDDTTPDAQ